jgi:hypothetical protein
MKAARMDATWEILNTTQFPIAFPAARQYFVPP